MNKNIEISRKLLTINTIAINLISVFACVVPAAILAIMAILPNAHKFFSKGTDVIVSWIPSAVLLLGATVIIFIAAILVIFALTVGIHDILHIIVGKKIKNKDIASSKKFSIFESLFDMTLIAIFGLLNIEILWLKIVLVFLGLNTIASIWFILKINTNNMQ